jgi:hypothetical protein
LPKRKLRWPNLRTNQMWCWNVHEQLKCDVEMFTNKWNAIWKGSWTKEMCATWINEQNGLTMATCTNIRILQWLLLVSHLNSISIYPLLSYSERRPFTEETWSAVGLRDFLQAAMTGKRPRYLPEIEPRSNYFIVVNKTRKKEIHTC